MSDETPIPTGAQLLAEYKRRNRIGKRNPRKRNDPKYCREKDLAEEYGLTFNQVHGLIWRAKQAKKLGKPDNTGLFFKRIPAAPYLTGDWMICGDVHAPTTDYALCQNMSQLARKLGIKNLLIAGDLLNLDAFSKHPPVSDRAYTVKREEHAAAILLMEWFEHFDRIVWTSGNHERRLSTKANGFMNIHELAAVILQNDPRLEVSERTFSLIDTGDPNVGLYRVTHPKNYSRLRLSVANRLALKFNQNIVVFHGHHLSKGYSDNGKVIADGGGLFDPEQLEYVQLNDTTAPLMRKGFCALRGSELTVYGEYPFTDWERVLR